MSSIILLFPIIARILCFHSYTRKLEVPLRQNFVAVCQCQKVLRDVINIVLNLSCIHIRTRTYNIVNYKDLQDNAT